MNTEKPDELFWLATRKLFYFDFRCDIVVVENATELKSNIYFKTEERNTFR